MRKIYFQLRKCTWTSPLVKAKSWKVGKKVAELTSHDAETWQTKVTIGLVLICILIIWLGLHDLFPLLFLKCKRSSMLLPHSDLTQREDIEVRRTTSPRREVRQSEECNMKPDSFWYDAELWLLKSFKDSSQCEEEICSSWKHHESKEDCLVSFPTLGIVKLVGRQPYA